MDEFLNIPTKIDNYAICQDCNFRDKIEKFPVEEEEELQGQIHCPKCGNENVEI